MVYKVVVDSNVYKYLNKLGSVQKSYFKRRFDKLKTDKKGYRLLDVSGNVELWELRSLSHRVYYTAEVGTIVITNIEYEGDIEVARAGNKNSQSKDIEHMKKNC